MVLHEIRPGWTITREWEGYQIKADDRLQGHRPDDYAGIFFSGGRAPEYIRDDPDLIRITQHFFDRGQPIASVCHGVEFPPAPTASAAAGWPASPSAGSTSRSAAASSSTSPASSTATCSRAAPSTTTATTSARGSAGWRRNGSSGASRAGRAE